MNPSRTTLPSNDQGQHLRAGRECSGCALHPVLHQEEAGDAGQPRLGLGCKVWRHLQVRGKLQLPVALVVLLEAAQPAQALVHLHAPACAPSSSDAASCLPTGSHDMSLGMMALHNKQSGESNEKSAWLKHVREVRPRLLIISAVIVRVVWGQTGGQMK